MRDASPGTTPLPCRQRNYKVVVAVRLLVSIIRIELLWNTERTRAGATLTIRRDRTRQTWRGPNLVCGLYPDSGARGRSPGLPDPLRWRVPDPVILTLRSGGPQMPNLKRFAAVGFNPPALLPFIEKKANSV